MTKLNSAVCFIGIIIINLPEIKSEDHFKTVSQNRQGEKHLGFTYLFIYILFELQYFVLQLIVLFNLVLVSILFCSIPSSLY